VWVHAQASLSNLSVCQCVSVSRQRFGQLQQIWPSWWSSFHSKLTTFLVSPQGNIERYRYDCNTVEVIIELLMYHRLYRHDN